MKFNTNHFNQIEGWCDEGIIEVYKTMAYTHNNATFVEIGSWKGKSAFCMASLIEEQGKNINFYCVDTWKGSEEHSIDLDVVNNSLFDVFQKNTELVKNYIKPIQLPSLEAAKQFEDESLDFVFIDAAHDYENVKNDINAWYPKVKKGGTIGGHDYHPTWSGVVKAVDEWRYAKNKLISVAVSSWFHHKISSN